jgi:hypothetical protein
MLNADQSLSRHSRLRALLSGTSTRLRSMSSCLTCFVRNDYPNRHFVVLQRSAPPAPKDTNGLELSILIIPSHGISCHNMARDRAQQSIQALNKISQRQ